MTPPPATTALMEAHERRLGRPIREVLVEMYETMTLEEIGAEFGLTQSGMTRWFARLEIPTRPGGHLTRAAG